MSDAIPLEESDPVSSSTFLVVRFLQEQDGNHKGRTVLTVLYLCVLGMCFVVPVFFYFRMQCDDRHNRRLREMEIAGIAQAMTESQNAQREESRATRRKYREERRARIIQLFSPVRMILKIENFPHLKVTSAGEEKLQATTTIGMEAMSNRTSSSGDASSAVNHNVDDEDDKDGHGVDNGDNIQVDVEAPVGTPSLPTLIHDSPPEPTEENEEDTFVLVPEPGLPNVSLLEFITSSDTIQSNNNQDTKLRRVQNECSICLCEYNVGSDIVWSSNPLCEHVFHETCIEQWLMKQRDGPMCPCCRRDFVIDPFDFGDDIETGLEANVTGLAGENEELPEVVVDATLQTIESSDAMSEDVRNTNDGGDNTGTSDGGEDRDHTEGRSVTT
mmetsp:Transcript_9203/g.14722  ORF Transcript_9203/g.14722 Transcript_9203/m.14722 type:complete len:386 (+) Transcript_9203:365-1522(+)